MNVFLERLSNEYKDNRMLLVCDGATWHKSKGLKIPENIEILHIPPYTPEMNSIEEILKQIRSMEFKNEFFHSLSDVVNRLCETINNLTQRNGCLLIFN